MVKGLLQVDAFLHAPVDDLLCNQISACSLYSCRMLHWLRMLSRADNKRQIAVKLAKCKLLLQAMPLGCRRPAAISPSHEAAVAYY
jgi:hypothetical protein